MLLLLCLQELRGKRDGGWGEKRRKKVSLRRLTADQKIASSSRKKKCLLVSKARVISYCLFPDTFRLQAFSIAFKVGAVNLANSLSPSSIVKKVRTGSKSGQGI